MTKENYGNCQKPYYFLYPFIRKKGNRLLKF